MIILGIDPGIALVGYGLIDFDGNHLRCLEYGCISTPAGMSLPDRLLIIAQEMDQIIDQFRPDEVSFEELFFYQNKKTAMMVAQARGVEIYCAKKENLPLYEYTPLQIKQAITGYGRANKIQIQQSIQKLLHLTELPNPDDAADGLAAAICHGFAQRFKEEYRME